MTQLFNAYEYAKLHSIVFRDGYPGYRPNVVESPNGDGKLDTEKRFAHVATKYLDKMLKDSEHAILSEFLDVAHDKAVEVAIAIGVPPQFWPSRTYSALRVLEYGPTAITNKHTDFDLFTLMCYRNLPEYFKYSSLDSSQYKKNALLAVAKQLNSQVHFGELLEEIDPNTYAANPHEVIASGGPSQYSVVYFAVPCEETAVLPSGLTVGEWMLKRKGMARYER